MEVNMGEKLWWEINEMVNTRESVDIACPSAKQQTAYCPI